MDVTTTGLPTTITTERGIPGLESCRTWELLAIPEGVFFELRSVDMAGIAPLVTDPWLLAPGYEPDIPDADLADLGITDPADAIVLAIVNIQAAERTAYLNLLAPLVINRHTGAARQVILDRQGWPARHALTFGEA